MHTRGGAGGSVRQARAGGQVGGRWRADMHVDARAVVGERGRIIEVGGGANDQLVRGGHWTVVRRARVCLGVARGGHDDHLRF